MVWFFGVACFPKNAHIEGLDSAIFTPEKFIVDQLLLDRYDTATHVAYTQNLAHVLYQKILGAVFEKTL